MYLMVGKTFTFESAHFIEGHPTCGQLHGHTWTLEVKLLGETNELTGMVIDFKELGKIVRKVTDHLDHRAINDVLPKVRPLTAETLVVWIVETLAAEFASSHSNIDTVVCRLQEGPGGWAEYFVEKEIM